MMRGPLCPHCDTPIVDGALVCRNSLCMQACSEMAKAMVAGEEGDTERWKEHYRKERELIERREEELRCQVAGCRARVYNWHHCENGHVQTR